MSTFTASYEVVKATNGMPSSQKELNIEGSLFLLRCSVAPYYKLRLLNRINREDLYDTISDSTEFQEKENFVAYNTIGVDGFPVSRVFYFSIADEKTQFLEEVKKCV